MARCARDAWFAICLGLLACESESAPPASESPLPEAPEHAEGGLEDVARGFGSWNPSLAHVRRVSEQVLPGSDRAFLLAHAVRADSAFAGSMDDEAFGVFVVDTESGAVTEILGFIPTCRWFSCRAQLAGVWEDSVRVEWFGVPYRDQRGSRTFRRVGDDSR